MYKIQEVADRLNVSYSVIYRLLRRGEMKCNRVGKAARISEDQIQAYLNRDRASKAPPEPGGLDLAIRCPKCQEELVRHRSENMINDLQNQHSADCRQCKLRIIYKVVGFGALDQADQAEVLSGLGAMRQSAVDLGHMTEPDQAEIDRVAGAGGMRTGPTKLDQELAELVADTDTDTDTPPPRVLEATPNPCPECKGHPSGSFERKTPVDVVATLHCRQCNPEMKFGLGPRLPVIQAQAATPDDAMNQAVEAWNLVAPLITDVKVDGEIDTDTDTDTTPEEVTQ